MKKFTHVLTFSAFGLAATLTANGAGAEILLGNTFDGNTDGAALYAAGQVTADGVASEGVGRPGYIAFGGTDVLRAAELRTFAQPLNFTRFFSFELTPDAGTTIDFENFVYSGFTTLAPGATVGPNTYVLRSNLTGFGTDITGTAGDAAGTFDLSGAEYQGVASAIQFRLFIQSTDGAGASPDTTYSLDDFAFNGTAVPEPASAALLAGGTLCLMARRRRIA